MSEYSRRTFLIGTGAGVATGVGATALAAPALAAPAWPAAKAAPAGHVSDEAPLVAYVRDVAAGEISLMTGDREVVITDRALAARLARKIG